MKKKSIWFGSAAALILFACWLLMQSGSKPQSEGEMTSKPKSARAASNDEDLARERSARRKASGRVLPEGSITTHQPEQLKDFVLTECKGHQVSLRTALKLIDEAYQDACYFSLEKPLKLKYEIDGESDKLLNFSLKGKSWLSAVEYVAALAGMEIKCDGEKVTLSTMEDADEPQQMKTSISPELLEQLQQTLRDLGLSENTTSDPQASITTLLSLNSIIENAQVVYQPDIGILAVNGTVRECNALGTMIKLGEANFKQFKTITKLISTKNPLEISKNTLSPTELQELMRQLSQQKGIELVTAPSIMSKNGQDALIEIKQGHGDNWTGLELRYNNDYIGLKMASANQTELRPKEGGGENQQAESQFLVYGGDSQVKLLGDDSKGYHYQITTLQKYQQETFDPIDPSFMNQIMSDVEKLPQSTPPIAKPVPGQPGFVFSPFNNKIVDVSGIPSGTLIADPQFPEAEKKHFRAP